MPTDERRGGWSNPASRINGAKGGRPRTHTQVRLAPHVMDVLYAKTRLRLDRRDVTETDLANTIGLALAYLPRSDGETDEFIPQEREQIHQLVLSNPLIDFTATAFLLDEAIDSYAKQALEKYGDVHGGRTVEEIAQFIVDQAAYDAGQSDAR